MNKVWSLPAIISTEFIKLKKCKILWCIPLCAILPDALIFSMYAFNKKYPIVDWNEYVSNAATFFNLLMAVGFFALIAGFIFSREYGENTVNVMFTYPISRVQFFIGKLIVMLILISITTITSFVLLMTSGIIIKHEPLTANILLAYGKAYVLMIIMHFALVPIMAFLSIYNKSMIPSLILGVASICVNLLILNTPFNTLFPWTVPTILSPHLDGRTYTNYLLGEIVLIITFILGIILSIKSVKNDVH